MEQPSQQNLANTLHNTMTMIMSMLALQHQNNLKTKGAGENYLQKKLDFDTAIMVETAELADSTNFKWWKDTTSDLENIRTEIVDIWHFLMSKFLSQSGATNENIGNVFNYFGPVFQSLFVQLVNVPGLYASGYYNDGPRNLHNIRFNAKKVLRFVLNNEEPIIIMMPFVNLIIESGMTFEEFYSRYLTKNALNTLRQNHGYKEGNYRKYWSRTMDSGNVDLVEDNYVAVDLVTKANEGRETPMDFNEVYGVLETFYVSLSPEISLVTH